MLNSAWLLFLLRSIFLFLGMPGNDFKSLINMSGSGEGWGRRLYMQLHIGIALS